MTDCSYWSTNRLNMKNNLKIFKDAGFVIDVETKGKIVNSLDLMFNLNFLILKLKVSNSSKHQSGKSLETVDSPILN